MKQLITLLFLLPLSCFAQNGNKIPTGAATQISVNAGGYYTVKQLRGPMAFFPYTNLSNEGVMWYDSAATKKYYFYNGTSQILMSGGLSHSDTIYIQSQGGGGSTDSSTFYPNYRADTSRANIYGDINTKLSLSGGIMSGNINMQGHFLSTTNALLSFAADGSSIGTQDGGGNSYWSVNMVNGNSSLGDGNNTLGIANIALTPSLNKINVTTTNFLWLNNRIITFADTPGAIPTKYDADTAKANLRASIATKGTVTKDSAGYGLLGGNVTTSGYKAVDSTLQTTRARLQKVVDSLSAIIGTKGSGTVTSVSGTATRISSTGGATPVIDLVTANATPATSGSGTVIPVITYDAYGRVTAVTTATNTPAYANVTGTPNLAIYAPIASPTLTGTPIAPTATGGTNTTQIATTAFVQSALPTTTAGGDLTGTYPNPTIKTSVSLTTPSIGVATATSINKVVIPAPATSASITMTNATNLQVTANAVVAGTNTGDQTTSGTTNQISVATGTTTPVISLSSGGTLPGAWALGTPASMVGTNLTGTGSGFTAGNVTTNANLTGDITSSGNATTAAATMVKTVVLNTPSVIYTTPVTFNTATNTATGTLALANQNPHTVLAGATSGTTTPTFRAIDESDLPTSLPHLTSASTLATVGTITALVATAATITSLNVTTSSGTWIDFSGTIAPTGYTGSVTVTYAFYMIDGSRVWFRINFTGTSNTTACTFTLPVAAGFDQIVPTKIVSSNTGAIGQMVLTNGSTTCTLNATLAGGAFGGANSKGMTSIGFYYKN